MPRRSSRRPATASPEGAPPRTRPRPSESDNEPSGSPEKKRKLHELTGSQPKPSELSRDILLDVKGEETALPVKSIDLQLAHNRQRHHTHEYEIEDLIVRRGQAFDLSITLGRDYDADNQEIILQFSIGKDPLEANGTIIRLSTKSKYSLSDWVVSVQKADGPLINLSVVPSADAIFGKYSVAVETQVDSDGDGNAKIFRKTFKDPVYVIFNAWCKDDTVYMEDEHERDEYVLNEKGRIWIGSKRGFRPRPWTFGQFEDVCIETVLFLLEEAQLTQTSWGNPIDVIRTLSAMSNSMDDNGVLTGRWDGDYPEGTTKPWTWTGSIAILEKFMKTKKSVEFGQCWVFSGLITTLLRAVGIPTRSVTNFESAHDTDGSMTIDTYWKEDDSKDDDHDYNDSIWNFHVWNESWIRRPDLPPGYDGWQAHDATPQEMSEGVMRCGPSPLKAIKEGHLWLNYDSPFIFGEVNGDKLHWRNTKGRPLEFLTKEPHVVGFFMSTKAPGTVDTRLDVTHLYKYPENSEDERRVVASVFKRSKLSKKADVYGNLDTTNDVEFKEEIPAESKYGEDFSLPLKISNGSDAERSVTVKMSAIATFYTGSTCERIKDEVFRVVVPPNETETIALPIKESEYRDKLTKGDFIKVFVNAKVHETGQRYLHSESMQLVKPVLLLDAPDNVGHWDTFTLKIDFMNSLGRDITGVVLSVSGAGIVRDLDIPIEGGVRKGETISKETTLKGKRTGLREIVVTLESNEVNDISSCREITVSSKD